MNTKPIKAFFSGLLLSYSMLGINISTYAVGEKLKQGTPANPCEVLGGCVTGLNSAVGKGGIAGFAGLVLTVASYLTYFSVALAVLFIVYAGFQILTSAGDKTRYENGVKTLKYAVIGLVIAIIATTIVTLIGKLTTFDITAPITKQ